MSSNSEASSMNPAKSTSKGDSHKKKRSTKSPDVKQKDLTRRSRKHDRHSPSVVSASDRSETRDSQSHSPMSGTDVTQSYEDADSLLSGHQSPSFSESQAGLAKSKGTSKKTMLKYMIHEVRELKRQLDPNAQDIHVWHKREKIPHGTSESEDTDISQTRPEHSSSASNILRGPLTQSVKFTEKENLYFGQLVDELKKRFGIEVKDFGRSWRDGHAFSAMVHNIRPELVDMTELPKHPNRINLENAFSKAEQHLGIPRLIDPEDVDVDKPDEKSIMTYVAKFLEKYPDPDTVQTDVGDPKDENRRATAKESEEYSDLMMFLDGADNLLTVVNSPVHDRNQEYIDYLKFHENLDLKYEVYERLSIRAEQKAFLIITEEKWLTLKQRWSYVMQQTRVWQWKLDSNLPGELGQIGDWLYRAEEMLAAEVQHVSAHDETADQIQHKLNEIKVFFQDLESKKCAFEDIRRAGVCDSQKLQHGQLQNMHQRFQQLESQSKHALYKLEYEEMKHRLLGFLVAAEAKLKHYTTKLGYQPDVEQFLADYEDFVHHRQLFENYDRTNEDCRNRAEVYKRNHPKMDRREVNKTLDDMTGRWNNVKVEILSVKTSLEETVEYWRRYNACVDLFHVWLNNAEDVLKKSPEERQDFFNNMDEWLEKLQTLKEASSFLVEVVQEPITLEIKNQVSIISKRFSDVQTEVESYMKQQTLQHSERKYQDGVMHLSQYLDNAEDLLMSHCTCTVTDLRGLMAQLEVAHNGVEAVEEDFKAVSKLAQSMVKDSSPGVISHMLNELKMVKERIVRVRRDVPEKLKPLRILLPQVESLENGILDLDRWIQEGLELLDSHKIDDNINGVEERLEKHKAHFSQTTYHKSILESKMKVYQKVSRLGSKYLDTSSLDLQMTELKDKFTNVVKRSKEWEHNLDQGLRLWHQLQEKASPVEEWVTRAEEILADTDATAEERRARHQAFFKSSHARTLQDFQKTGQDLMKLLKDDDREEVESSLKMLEERYKELSAAAPAKLILLEFQEAEEKFIQCMNFASQSLEHQQHALDQKSDIKQILEEHKEAFQKTDLTATCDSYLEKMRNAAERLNVHNPNDGSLQETLQAYEKQGHSMKSYVEDLRMQLEEVPERWQEYRKRLEAFNEWMVGVEATAADLERESISSQEYKETVSLFQGIIQNIDSHKEEAKWLRSTLGDLLQTLPGDEATHEKLCLEESLQHYRDLMPTIEVTETKSSIVVKCYDYKEELEQKMEWLNETEDQVREDLPLDDLGSVRVLLEQQEDILSQLQQARPKLESDIHKGRSLAEAQDAPEFVSEAVNVLEETLNETVILAEEKYSALKDNLAKWEQYEASKTEALTLLREAEASANRSVPPGGQEAIHKELASKETVIRSLQDLSAGVSTLRAVGNILQSMASEPRQQQLQHEINSIEGRMEQLMHKSTARVEELKASDTKWTDFYIDMTRYTQFLEEKEAELQKIQNSDLSLEEKYRQSQLIHEEIMAQDATLQQLEQQGAELSKGFRSREIASVKSKLASARRVHEKLHQTTMREVEMLSDDVTHWNQYQDNVQHLLPWIDDTERFLTEDDGQVSSLEDALQQYSKLQDVLSEREIHEDKFDRLISEGHHLEGKPGFSGEIDAIQERWNLVTNAADTKAQKLKTVIDGWNSFQDQSVKVGKIFSKYESKLQDLPTNSLDTETLKNVLDAQITAQQEFAQQRAHVANLSHLSGQLSPSLSTMANDDLSTQECDLEASWDEINEMFIEKIGTLNSVIEERESFWHKWNKFEQWLDDTNMQVDATSEIYSDDITNTKASLQTIQKNLFGKITDFDSLSSDVEKLSAQCSDEDRERLKDQHHTLSQKYQSINDMVNTRINMCANLSRFNDLRQSTVSRANLLKQKLESQDLSPEDLSKIHAELAEIQNSVSEWNIEQENMEELLATSNITVKDRATQRTLHMQAETNNLITSLGKTATELEQKKGKLDELSALWKNFDEQKQRLLDAVTQSRDKVDRTTIKQVSLEGVKEYNKQIKQMDNELSGYGAQYEELRDLGRQLMSIDHAHMLQAQDSLSTIENQWESAHTLSEEKHTHLDTVTTVWQEFNEIRESVRKTLNSCESALDMQMSFNDQSEVKESLNQIKAAEVELQVQQRQMDSMNTCMKQLIHEAQTLSGFEPSILNQDVQNLNSEWQSTSQRLSDMKETLEDQIAAWDVIDDTRDEVSGWLDNIMHNLEHNTASFGDCGVVKSNLEKYRTELPSMEEIFQGACHKIANLQAINSGQEIHALTEARQVLEYQFAQAAELADNLDMQVQDFESECDVLETQLEQQHQVVNQLRKRIAEVDDISGSDEDLVNRLASTKVLRTELESQENKIGELLGELSKLGAKYQSNEALSLTKDVSVLNKKHDAALQKAKKVEDTLHLTLEQHLMEAQQEHRRWLDTLQEKIPWCSDTSGDKYSIQAKLSTVQDLLASVPVGEQKTDKVGDKIELLKAVTSPHEHTELDNMKHLSQEQLQSITETLLQTKSELEHSMSEWQGYNELYDRLTEWIKDTDVKVRSESSPKADLTTKLKQLDTFKNIDADIAARSLDVDLLNSQAEDISNKFAESRISTYVQQLNARYKTLSATVKDQVEKLDQNVTSHQSYLSASQKFSCWLEEASKELTTCSDTRGHQDSLESKLESLNQIKASKDQGQIMFETVKELSEKLYPNTSKDGRELIRQDLGRLRDQWDSLVDGTNDAYRRLLQALVLWNNYSENYEQLLNWMNDMEHNLTSDIELKSTLQDKKAMLQSYRGLRQDIASHQSAVNSVMEHGRLLNEPTVLTRLNQLDVRHEKLNNIVKEHVNECEEIVTSHQQYENEYTQCVEWLQIQSSLLHICAEPASDKLSIHNKLDKLQELEPVCGDGESRIRRLCHLAEDVSTQTAPQGQQQIQQDLDSLKHDWTKFNCKVTETKAVLESAKEAWQDFDVLSDDLSKWLNQVEANMKDNELKSTLVDKKLQLDRFKVMQTDIASQQPNFEAVNVKAQHLDFQDAKNANLASVLTTRYFTLKNDIQDVVSKCELCVRDQEQYDTVYSSTTAWLNQLNKRLTQLSHSDADHKQKHNKIQELVADREQGDGRIYHAIEVGEQLYPGTAVEGRDIIRQQLRSLRESWELFTDEIRESQRELEITSVQLSSFEESFDQFQKWLLNVQLVEEQKATLQDKKLQLQHHRSRNHDLISHQHVLDSLSERALALTQVTKSHVASQLDDLRNQYTDMCKTSKTLLVKYEDNINTHQTYTGKYQACEEQISAMREKLNTNFDVTGDQFTVQNKLEALQELTKQVADCEMKVRQLGEYSNEVISTSSPPGMEMIRREMNIMQNDISTLSSELKDMTQEIQNALKHWQNFEEHHEAMQHWLTRAEMQLKDVALGETLEEKQEQSALLKDFMVDIQSKQTDLDKFTDIAQALMHASGDMKVNTHLSQANNRYKNLQASVKSLILKWEHFVSDHQLYRERYREFTQWLTQTTESLEKVKEMSNKPDTLECSKEQLEVLLIEQKQGLHKIDEALKQGEKLYPDTSVAGRENIRKQLRTAKEIWDTLMADINETGRRLDTTLSLFNTYTEDSEQLKKWLLEVQIAIKSDTEFKNTLQEKRSQLQSHKTLLQDIVSHGHVIDSISEKLPQLGGLTNMPDILQFVTDTKSTYSNLLSSVKELILNNEEYVSEHSQFEDQVQTCTDWLQLMHERLKICADFSGDKHSIDNKLERVKDLIKHKDDGNSKINQCTSQAEKTKLHTGTLGCSVIQKSQENLTQSWTTYCKQVQSIQIELTDILKKWQSYEASYDNLVIWVKDTEKKMKEVTLLAVLDEKKDQVKYYQDLAQEIHSHQPDIDKLTDEGQLLVHDAGEARITTYMTQLNTRYYTLVNTVKDKIRKGEQNVLEHDQYEERLAEASTWLQAAQERYVTCGPDSNSKDDLNAKQTVVQELVQYQDQGLALLNKAVESGEMLYPSTSSEGREVIRRQLRMLKQNWDDMYDEVLTAQRQLEVNLVQWTSFEDSYEQLEAWMRNMEQQLTNSPLHNTLEEKKSQLQTYKNLNQDAQSYQRVIDNTLDKAKTLSKTSTDSAVMAKMTNIAEQYDQLRDDVNHRIHHSQQVVKDHQEYQNAHYEFMEWLNTMKERSELCADTSGDRHTVQMKLERLKDIDQSRADGESKVDRVIALNEKAMQTTSSIGQEALSRASANLKSDWNMFLDDLQQIEENLVLCVTKWRNYEEIYENCASRIRTSENIFRLVDLKTTLMEKQETQQKLRGLYGDLQSYQADMDEMIDKSQILAKSSTDTRVASQASHLAVQYKNLELNVKECMRRWEQYVLDHQNYDDVLQSCIGWQKDVQNRLANCISVEGDQYTLHTRLSKVQDMLMMNDEGFRKLQQVTDSANLVIPNTSTLGKDSITEDLNNLRQTWDDILLSLKSARDSLDKAIRQWQIYDDDIKALSKWLSETEKAIQMESGLQATLSEKQNLSVKIKVMVMNVNSREASFAGLQTKADNLSEMVKDVQRTDQARQLLKKYDDLKKQAKDLLHKCESHVADHQAYQNHCQDARDWLNMAQDHLVSCVDVHGDRLSLNGKKEKIDVLLQMIADGEVKIHQATERMSAVLPNTSSRGQEMLEVEFKSLNGDYRTWSNNVQDTNAQIVDILHHWAEYDQLFEQLSEWMKDTESKVKGVVMVKATLHEKLGMFDKYKDYYGEVVSKQSTFDTLSDKAQLLLQHSTDSRITAQLTQLNSRYTALLTFTKDSLKKLEQNAETHSRYNESHKICSEWINGMLTKLSSCQNTTQNKEAIQTQLEVIHELLVLKEEGQALMHAAHTWGDRTANTSSGEGHDLIMSQVQALQKEWDDLFSSITSARMAQESCLLQWSDFDDSFEQIKRWLKDMERRLKDDEPKADLSEKKAMLQRIKGLHQDIQAYEPMIDSFREKTDGLTTKSPGDTLNSASVSVITRYVTLKDRTLELLDRRDSEVKKHTAFLEACNTCISWVRTARDTLATSSDVYGDRDTLYAKLDRINNLKKRELEGSQYLEEARGLVEELLVSTAPVGHPRIHAQLQTITTDYEDFNKSLLSAHQNLEKCLGCWSAYEKSQLAFKDWLQEADELLSINLELEASLSEKQALVDQFQVHLSTIKQKQSDMEDVSQKAQDLLEQNADTSISHSITQLTTTYQALFSKAKEVVRRLESSRNDHQLYLDAADTFQMWLEKSQDKLVDLSSKVGSKEDIENRLTELRNISPRQLVQHEGDTFGSQWQHPNLVIYPDQEFQTTLDHGQGKLQTTSDLRDKVLLQTSQGDSEHVYQQWHSYHEKFEKLKYATLDTRSEIERVLSNWIDYEHAFEQFNTWLKETEVRVKSDPSPKGDLAEKKAHLEKMKMIKKDVISHEVHMSGLVDKSSDLDDTTMQEALGNVRHRYQALCSVLQDQLTELLDQVTEHELYQTKYQTSMDWVITMNHQVQNVRDSSGLQQDLQSKLDKLLNLKATLSEGQSLFDETEHLSDRVEQNTSTHGCVHIQREIQILKDELSSLENTIIQTEQSLSSSLHGLEEFSEARSSFTEWLDGAERRMKNKSDYLDSQAPEELVSEYQIMFEEIAKHKQELEKLMLKSETVPQRSSDPDVSSSLMQLTTRYQTLQAVVKESSRKVEEFGLGQHEYKNAYAKCTQWLDETTTLIESCRNTDGDSSSIKTKLKTAKVISATLDEGSQKLATATDAGNKLIVNCSSDGAASIQAELHHLKATWSMLNSTVKDVITQLDGQLKKWQLYQDCDADVQKWLSEYEGNLKVGTEPKSVLQENKAQIQKFKNLHSSLEIHASELEDLAGHVSELQDTTPDNNIKQSYENTSSRYHSAVAQCQDVVRVLDEFYTAHQTFRNMLQDCEKWILLMSFQLMSHNTMDVSTIELTERQIAKHQTMMQEIDVQKEQVTAVHDCGDQLIALSTKLPKMAQSTQTQLGNLHDSYSSLQDTANQIKDRLSEVLSRWQKYQDLLDECDQYLQMETFPWLQQEQRATADDISQSRKQNITKDMLDRLFKFKQDLSSASGYCENLGNSSPDPSAVEQSDLTRQATHINSCINDAIYQLEAQLAKYTESIIHLEAVEMMKSELNGWFMARSSELQQMKNKSTKLHIEAAELELFHLEELKGEISQKETALEKLATRYSHLAVDDINLVERNVSPLREVYNTLVQDVISLVTTRKELLTKLRTYHKSHSDVNTGIDEALDRLRRLQNNDDMPMDNRVSQLQVTRKDFPRRDKLEHSTQTPSRRRLVESTSLGKEGIIVSPLQGSRIPHLSTSHSHSYLRRSVSDDRESKIPQPTYQTSPRRSISSSPVRRKPAQTKHSNRTTLTAGNLTNDTNKIYPVLNDDETISPQLDDKVSDDDSESTLHALNQSQLCNKQDFACQTDTYIIQYTPEGLIYQYPVSPYHICSFTSPEDSDSGGIHVGLPLNDISISSEVSTQSSQNEVVQAILEADRNMQDMMSTVNIPVNGVGLFRGRHQGEEPVRVIYDRHYNSALTDSAKQAALMRTTHNSVMPNSTWPVSDHIHDVSLDQNHDEMFSSPRSLHSLDTTWTLENNPELSNSMKQQRLEVVAHDVSRTTHILRPTYVILSDDATDDGQETETDYDVHNASWNSGMTEPERVSELVDTKEDETQTPRHRKTQTLLYATTQTPRRQLPIIPGHQAANRDLHDHTDQDLMTNHDLMHTIMGQATINSPAMASLSIHSNADDTPQPEYLRDYQKYIESFDGTKSGPFVCSYDDDHDQGPGTAMLNQPYDDSSPQQGDNMPNTTPLHNIMPRGSTVRAHSAHQRDNMGTYDQFTSMQPSNAFPKWDSTDNIFKDMRRSRGCISLPVSRPTSAHGHSQNVKPQGRLGLYVPGRATPLAQNVLDRIPLNSPSVSSSKVQSAWYQPENKRDFAQQTMETSATQTPLKINIGTGSQVESIMVDSDGMKRALSVGLHPWNLLNCTARDFSTQTFGQWYEGYHNHIGTQTQGIAEGVTNLVNQATQTLNDGTTQTPSPAELLLQPGSSASHHVPSLSAHSKFAADSFVGFQQGMYPRVSVPPPQSTVSEEDEPVDPVPSVSMRMSRKDKHHKQKRDKKKKTSHERSHDKETEDNQSVMTSQTKMSRRDILKFMLKQVKDLKEKLDPDLIAASKDKKDRNTKAKDKAKSKGKRHKAHDDDSAIESFGEDGEMDDKLYSRQNLEMLYSRPVTLDNEAFRNQRRHSVESLHSDNGYEREDSYDRAYDRLRDKYIPRKNRLRVDRRKAYTPPPMRRNDYSYPYIQSHMPHNMHHTSMSRGRSPVHRGPSRYMLPHRPQHMSTHITSPGYQPAHVEPVPARFTPHHNPHYMQPMMPAQQNYVSPHLAQVSTPILPKQGMFRPISTQPGQQMTPVHGTPMLLVQNDSMIQNSPHPPYLVMASTSKRQSDEQAHHGRRSIGASLDNSFSKVTQAAREMKSLTKRMNEN